MAAIDAWSGAGGTTCRRPGEEDDAQGIWVEVAYASGPRQVACVRVPYSPLVALTVQTAIAASGLLERFPEIGREDLAVGIWGRVAARDTPVRARDRIEIYRPLKVDPKEARRLRSQKQGPVRSRHRPRYKTD